MIGATLMQAPDFGAPSGLTHFRCDHSRSPPIRHVSAPGSYRTGNPFLGRAGPCPT
jgi:hypothetical protein